MYNGYNMEDMDINEVALDLNELTLDINEVKHKYK